MEHGLIDIKLSTNEIEKQQIWKPVAEPLKPLLSIFLIVLTNQNPQAVPCAPFGSISFGFFNGNIVLCSKLKSYPYSLYNEVVLLMPLCWTNYICCLFPKR